LTLPVEANLRFAQALAAYDSGMKLEQDDRYRISNSYNLVQHVVVPILTSPQLFGGDDLKKKLVEVLHSIDRQIKTSRADDAWAYSDLGLVHLLLGDESLANDAWDQMDEKKLQDNVYTSGLPVLQSLSAVLRDNAPLHRAVERFRLSLPNS
jgi:hypothetical protein